MWGSAWTRTSARTWAFGRSIRVLPEAPFSTSTISLIINSASVAGVLVEGRRSGGRPQAAVERQGHAHAGMALVLAPFRIELGRHGAHDHATEALRRAGRRLGRAADAVILDREYDPLVLARLEGDADRPLLVGIGVFER